MGKIRFIGVTLCGIFATLYILIVAYLYLNQEDFIFQPAKLSRGYQFQFDKKFEELNIPSYDGINLNGLLFKAENPKGLIFYLHGNAGALDTWGNIAQIYTDLGYDFFILDYRGFGKSEGKIESEEQFYKDVTFAYRELLKRYEEDRILIIGYSIGTGPASYLASTNSPKAIILQAPYYNFSKMADSRFPFLPEFVLKYKFAIHSSPKLKPQFISSMEIRIVSFLSPILLGFKNC